jgi:hypothetical protein
MYTQSWLVIKDDTKRTYEICGKASNTNAFTNSTYAWQKAGMNVTCMTPPVANNNVNKDIERHSGYKPEEGLYKRLSAEYMKIVMGSVE